jgi:hypothetical protein
MFNSNIEIWKNAAHGGGPWTRSMEGVHGPDPQRGSMYPVQTRGPWTGGPCFVLSLFLGHFSFVRIFLKNYRVTMTTTLELHVRKIQWFCQAIDKTRIVKRIVRIVDE